VVLSEQARQSTPLNRKYLGEAGFGGMGTPWHDLEALVSVMTRTCQGILIGTRAFPASSQKYLSAPLKSLRRRNRQMQSGMDLL
jgi:hypothetical protein